MGKEGLGRVYLNLYQQINLVSLKGEVNQKLKIPVYVYIHEITAK